MKRTSEIGITVLKPLLHALCVGFGMAINFPDSLAFANNPEPIVAFTALLRDFDLNEDTQNSYAITETEYAQLQSAWENLTGLDKHQLLFGEAGMLWRNTFALLLLYDLNYDREWESHFENMADYGAQGLSLTLSLFNCPITVRTARKMLVDLLHKESNMFTEGKLEIPDEIKTAATERIGSEARFRLEKWERLINDHQNRSNMDKLRAINRFFNQQIKAQADAVHHDYWQSPIETMVRGVGDCDDLAMAKYVSLRLLHIPLEQLQIAVVEEPGLGGHVVLLFYPPYEKDPRVLDNLTFDYLGFKDSHILRLSQRRIFHKIKLLWGMNEKQLTAFQGDPNIKVESADPGCKFPKFGIALINSRRVLPSTN